MHWIEIIHVRAFSQATKQKALRLARELSLSRVTDTLSAVTFWVRSDLQTDISILLRWIEDVDRRAYSPLGLQLAEEFTEFGWVTHSVWQDAKSGGTGRMMV